MKILTTTRFTPIKIALLIISLNTLQGCVGVATVAVVAGVSIATDERTLSTQIDDKTIEFNANSAISKEMALVNQTNIHVISINGAVLLIGQAPNRYLRDLAVKKVSTTEGVRKVYNQIRLGNIVSFTTSSNDAWLTSKVKTALFGSESIDATNIKVITENGEVFLMGIVAKSVANEAVEIARNIGGVNRVFKVFEYI